MSLPKIAITVGDPAGIGPEIAEKAAADPSIREICEPIIFAPPADASPQVNEGFTAFRIHCTRCHAVNGDGGTIGPELNRTANPAGRRDAAWLRRWIDDPAAISPNTRMERLNPELHDRAHVIDAIVAYLQAMAR